MPPKTPIIRFNKRINIWPLSSEWNIKLNKYVNDIIDGPYSKYKIYKYSL